LGHTGTAVLELELVSTFLSTVCRTDEDKLGCTLNSGAVCLAISSLTVVDGSAERASVAFFTTPLTVVGGSTWDFARSFRAEASGTAEDALVVAFSPGRVVFAIASVTVAGWFGPFRAFGWGGRCVELLDGDCVVRFTACDASPDGFGRLADCELAGLGFG
jgi:hypothetical protein